MNKKHGMYGTSTYKSWSEMICRCKFPNHSKGKYENVEVCDRWINFKNFFEDMGERPDNTSLDRINPKGNYEPNNCRWADKFIQANNKTNNIKYKIDDENLTLPQIARKYDISRSNLANKIYIYKMSMQDAIDYLLSKKEKRC